MAEICQQEKTFVTELKRRALPPLFKDRGLCATNIMTLFKGKKADSVQDKAPEPLFALDIGTSKIRLIAGHVSDNGDVEITYFSQIASSGMVNGSVSDLNKLSDKISTLIQQYKQETQSSFSECFIGIAGRHIQSQNEKGLTTVPTHIVTEADKENAIEQARSAKFSEYNHILHVIPQNYEIDDSTDITNPIGLSALRLGVGVHLIACNEDQENNLKAAFEKLDNKIHIEHVIYNGIAAADAVLSQEEKEIGVCLIDFGGGTVNVSVYDRGKLVLTFGMDQGGSSITRDIATRFSIPLRMAEYIKQKFGVAHPFLLDKDVANVKLAVKDNDDRIYVRRDDLSTVVGIALNNFFKIINDKINRYRQHSGSELSLGAGYVITGGVALTEGITTLAHNKVTGPDSSRAKVIIGFPKSLVGENSEKFRSPEMATAVGLLRFGHALKRDKINKNLVQKELRKNNGVFSKTVHWVKDWLSKEF